MPQTKPAARKIVFSGIQPSGRIMLGNYLGALKNWVGMQHEHDCVFCLVDLHAITVRQDPARLRELSYEGLALYLAAGLDPQKSTLFVQSQVPAHAELGWILGCYAYMGELSRMTQFKDKSSKQKNIGTGLFTYPVLMAADILLYQTNLVPVGHDQKQHLELARDLAIRWNGVHGEVFRIPEPYIPPTGARIMSLADPTAKMSKSDPEANATIFLMDPDDVIRKKVKRAVTDSGSEITYQDDKPGIKNLLAIQSAILGKSIESLVEQYAGKQYGALKVETAEVVVECVRPIRDEASRILRDRAALDQILRRGAEQASARATPTLRKVQDALGFIL